MFTPVFIPIITLMSLELMLIKCQSLKLKIIVLWTFYITTKIGVKVVEKKHQEPVHVE